MSSAIACVATRLMSSGAAKSGKPWDKLTAPCFRASRVISRITDSVKRLAFRDTCSFEEHGGVMINLFSYGAADFTGGNGSANLFAASCKTCSTCASQYVQE